MKACSYLHVADLHLDSPFKGLQAISSEMGERVRKSTFEALQNMVKLAIELRVDFIVVSGDVYDAADRSLQAQLRLQKAFHELAKQAIPTYIVHGNHDPENGRRAHLKWPESVHFFASDHVETIDVKKSERGVIAQIHGISYATSEVKENLAIRYKRGNQDAWQIGVLHANVDGDLGHESYAPCSKQELLQRGMDYWALGHVHTRKIMHENPFIVYPGNIQGRSIRELGARGCYHVQVDEHKHCQLTFHALDTVRWMHEKISIAGLESEQELRDVIDQKLREVKLCADGRDVIVRLVLEGRGIVHRALQQVRFIEQLLAELRDEQIANTLIWIESIDDQTGNDLDLAKLIAEPSFIGDVLREAQNFREDKQLIDHFVQGILRSIKDLPVTMSSTALTPEQVEAYLRAAEELAVDYLVKDGGQE